MISPFSRLMDYAVDAHFMKDRSGRLVFVPFGLKRKCYFVDSKSDEEKIRPFVRMYRSASQWITLLISPILMIPALILDEYAGLTPRSHRFAIAFGIPTFFWLVLIGLLLMLWGLYKGGIPSLTSSLIEVEPDLKGQLSGISQRPWRPALLVMAALLLLLAAALFALVAVPHSHR
jgi:peptidoglycan/LPS O-acetylase OafA/YrhL